MLLRPPRATRPDTRFPHTTLVRSLRERRRRKHRGPDSERGAANKNTDDHEGKVSPCTRIVTCAGDRRICFPDGTDKLTRAHRQPGKALLLSIARSPLAPAHVPELPSIAGVELRVARARYKTWDRCDLTFVTLDQIGRAHV